MAAVHRQQPNRNLDLVLLTVGANDVNFAGLVANVIVDATTERLLLKQGGVDRQRRGLAKGARPGSARRIRAIARRAQALCRRQSRSRRLCLLRQSGDAVGEHSPAPAAATASTSIRRSAPTPSGCARPRDFVDNKFLPKLKMLATCDGNKICRDPATERMTFVDGHQAAFDRHGMCVRAASDPGIRSQLLLDHRRQLSRTIRPSRPTIRWPAGEPASNYRPYSPRGRWIRTANDSYFTAMTYPEGMPAMLKAERHPRRAVGRAQRRLWRRRASDRRRLRGDGRCRAAGRARRARPDARRPRSSTEPLPPPTLPAPSRQRAAGTPPRAP